MANNILKATKIANTAVGLLFRELVIARTVFTDAITSAEWRGAFGDTVTLRVPAKRTARTTSIRNGGDIVNDTSNEFPVPITLDSHVYNGAPITDAQLTLDITNFGTQILNPQVRAVAEGIEDLIAAEIIGATYETELPVNESDPYLTAVDARKVLNDANVPMSGRTLLVGSGVESAILKSDRLSKFDQSGSDDALREATIGGFAGFNVISSNAIPENEAYAYVRSAFVASVLSPANPEGATMSASANFMGFALRTLKDYDYTKTTDRHLVSSYVGTGVVEDPDDFSDPDSETSLIRAVKLNLPVASA